MIPHNYNSPHNSIKDEVFLYFVKQITAEDAEKFPEKCLYSYLYGLSVFTRHFCPSPVFLYPFTHYIHFLYKYAQEKKRSPAYINIVESIFENLLLFI